MKKDTIKKLLILFIILFLVIALLITALIFTNNNEEYVDEGMGDGVEDSFEEYWFNNVKELDITSADYITVKDCMQRYINIINTHYMLLDSRVEEEQSLSIEERSKMIYNMLSSTFVEKNNVNEKNVFEVIKEVTKTNTTTILQMKKLENTGEVTSFVSHIMLQDVVSFDVFQELYLIVYIDDTNSTYAIEPVNAKDINDINLEKNIEQIKINDNNQFKYNQIKDADVITEYINRYKRISLVYPDFVYNNLLNEEYREKRFGGKKEFKKYIENNKEKIKNINLKKYQTNADNAEYLQYVAIDQNGKYYIFRERSMTDFDLILDTYTIDIPEFIEKYDTTGATNKVALNANKIVEAANNMDYNYIYNKLDETYRNSNLGNIENLEQVIQNTFYENTVIKDAQCKQEGNVYVFTMQITNYEGTAKLKDVTIIMQLLEDRNFVMSFAK